MAYKVKYVSELTGVSVRTLHHYDEMKLLVPHTVTPAGHRLYADADLERLQQILFFRELGFSLTDIKEIVDDPAFDRTGALKSHRAWLQAQKDRIERMIATVDRTIDTIEGGGEMSREQMFEGFDLTQLETHTRQYAAEARERFGDKAMEEAEAKTKGYGQEEWARIMGESERNYLRIVAHMDEGPSNSEVQAAVADIRSWISNHFYNCTPEIFRGLGDLYVADARFTANIDKHKEGLAAFLREAMHVYCDRLATSDQP